MLAGLKVDFSRLLLAIIHERVFKSSTTYPFTCIIFELCRSSIVSNWHIDVLMTLTRTIDIGHIRDEDNKATPNIGLRVEVQLLGENLADKVEQV